MVFVKVSETYDLSTQTNKMALIGVHTPKTDLVRKTYPGLAMNTKFWRIDHQNVVIACASMQPADPLQVGVEAGDIAPEDLFNPILYKAVTNDSMSMIEARMHDLGMDAATTINGNQADVDNANVAGVADEFPVYYALLSNRDGFATSNPQQGVVMKDLKPLVFSMNYSSGAFGTGSNYQDIIAPRAAGGQQVTSQLLTGFRAGAKPMPRLPTSYVTGAYPGNTTVGSHVQYNGMGDGLPGNSQIKMPEVQPIYTACIIIPPSRLHKLYYRMQIETVIEFSEVRPIQDIVNFFDLQHDYYPEVYYTDYDLPAKSMQFLNSTVDTANADIKQVM